MIDHWENSVDPPSKPGELLISAVRSDNVCRAQLNVEYESAIKSSGSPHTNNRHTWLELSIVIVPF